MRTALGIVSLLLGVAFPMGMLLWLNLRMKREPPFTSRQTSLALSLNGALPVSLITLGIALLTGRWETSTPIRMIVVVCLVTAVIASIGLWWTSVASRRGDGRDR